MRVQLASDLHLDLLERRWPLEQLIAPARGADLVLVDTQRSRQWLGQQLSRAYGGRTVVITHHAPHPGSIHPRYAGDPVNGAFVSDLTELVVQADVWLHGHVHDSFDYRVGRCRVGSNPRGYAHNRSQATRPEDLVFENPAFRP